MKPLISIVKIALPWLITLIALYVAFRGLDWSFFLAHVHEASPLLLLLAVLLTVFSYLLRSFRWKFFFPERVFPFLQSVQVLVLGFFMNNILPARAGELVRAHMGARVTKQKRTLVLATIASERLADGVTISLMFLIFVQFFAKFSSGQQQLSDGLYYVSYLFAIACCAVFVVLLFRNRIFAFIDVLLERFSQAHFAFVMKRVKIFLTGLEPLFRISRLPAITILSLAVWLVELAVFFVVGKSFAVDLTFVQAIVFMVAVNFSSLIPAAPGGIGVIEAVATAVLVSLGYSQELALALVLSQHIIQYVVVGIPGAIFMIQLKEHVRFARQKAASVAV